MMKIIAMFCTILIALALAGCQPDVEPDANYEPLTIETASMLYDCPSRGITMPCDKLSQYVSPVGKCWNSEMGNRICKPGWQEVKDLPECVFYGPRSIYICDEEKCVLQVR